METRAQDETGSRDQARAEQPAEILTLIEEYLDQLAADTHRRLGEVAGVAVTMADHAGRPITIGSSTQLARSVDELQYGIGVGPCLNALRGGGGDYVPSLARDTRWGRYGPEAAALGAACCLSIPVETRGSVVAVLKVYDGEEDGLDADQRRIGLDAAQETAGGIGLAQTLTATTAELADRTAAMDSRRVIDLAIGVLMERTQCGLDDAFSLLRRYSQNRNVKVREVAAELIGTTTPDVASPSRADLRAPFSQRGAQPHS